MDVKKKLLLLLFVLGAVFGAKAQKVALKTNLLSDALLNVNAGVELGLAPRWTLDLSGQYNAWTVNEHKWKHWLVQPEARYWLCDRFAGHFFGLHAMGGQYNIGNIGNSLKFLDHHFGAFKDHRWQGWFAGAGIAYGYAWVLGKHWNFEAEIGVGYVHSHYDEYECKTCPKRTADDRPHDYFGPTKAALNLVYTF